MTPLQSKAVIIFLTFQMCVTLDPNMEINQKQVAERWEGCHKGRMKSRPVLLIYPRPSDNVLHQLLVVAGSHVSGHLSGNLIVICITFILWHIFKSQQSSLCCLCLVVECCHGKIILLKGKVRWHQCLGMSSLKTVALISFCKSLVIRTVRPYCKMRHFSLVGHRKALKTKTN